MANLAYDPTNEQELIELRRKKQQERDELEKQSDSPWIGALAGLASWASGKNDAGASIMERRDEPRKRRLSAIDKELESQDSRLTDYAKYKLKKSDDDEARKQARAYDVEDWDKSQKADLAKEQRQRAHELRKLAMEQGSAKKSFEALPQDSQEIIKDLSKKNASKISIRNQIDSTMSNWDSLDEDQKVSQGRMLLKTLNSTEGADAIGAEEAKRLGAKLEFAVGNLLNDNPIQFGRDLPGFKEQALLTSKAIGRAIEQNQNEVNRRYGRDTTADAGPPKYPPGSTVRVNGKLYKVGADGDSLEDL